MYSAYISIYLFFVYQTTVSVSQIIYCPVKELSGKGKVVPIHTTKAHRGSESTVPHILNLITG